jgi:glutamate racemase
MRLDLLAGSLYAPAAMPLRVPTVLVFDSGLGGLTVFAEVAKVRPDARFVYAADDAGFPYGRFDEDTLATRVAAVMERLIERLAPDLVVVACNTASTVNVVLPHLRAQFDVPFVGTVPAIKPAAALSRSKRVSVLATPGTVARRYTTDLIEAYAGDCAVTLVGAPRLAALATAELCGHSIGDDEVRAEIAPAFVEDGGDRTDVVVLGCTHYPLLLTRLERCAPWPVTWLDPAPAIARRVSALLGPRGPHRPGGEGEGVAVFTDGSSVTAALKASLAARGLPRVVTEAMPLLQA